MLSQGVYRGCDPLLHDMPDHHKMETGRAIDYSQSGVVCQDVLFNALRGIHEDGWIIT